MSSEITESTRGLEFLAWLELNKKRLIVGSIVAALLVSGWVIHRWRSAQLELVASSALIMAQLNRQGPTTEVTEVKPEVFLGITRSYPGTEAGQRALLFAAEALFRDGKYAESLGHFEAFRSSNPGNPLVATAGYGVAACLEALGRTNEAVSAYQQVITAHPDTAVSGESKLALAGLSEAANEPQQALQYYEQLRSSAWTSVAEQRRQAILAEHPELAETNTGLPSLSAPEGAEAGSPPSVEADDSAGAP